MKHHSRYLEISKYAYLYAENIGYNSFMISSHRSVKILHCYIYAPTC